MILIQGTNPKAATERRQLLPQTTKLRTKKHTHTPLRCSPMAKGAPINHPHNIPPFTVQTRRPRALLLRTFRAAARAVQAVQWLSAFTSRQQCKSTQAANCVANSLRCLPTSSTANHMHCNPNADSDSKLPSPFPSSSFFASSLRQKIKMVAIKPMSVQHLKVEDIILEAARRAANFDRCCVKREHIKMLRQYYDPQGEADLMDPKWSEPMLLLRDMIRTSDQIQSRLRRLVDIIDEDNDNNLINRSEYNKLNRKL